MIRFRFATLAFNPKGCTTIFEDGTTADAIPHDTPHYRIITARLGYGDDILGYCQEHEAAHHFVEENLHNRPSQVLWHVAHGQTLSGPLAAYEEMTAQAFQRWVRTNERPIVSGVDWDKLKREYLELMREDQDEWMT